MSCGHMESKLRTIVFMASLGVTSVGTAGDEMTTSYKIAMDNQAFSIAAPLPPDREFAKHRPFIPLHDDKLFEGKNRVVGLNVNWTYRTGLFRKVAGVLELKVTFRAAHKNNVVSDEGLKQQLLADFRRDLAEVGYSGGEVQFQQVDINGRSWLKYSVPVLGDIEYSTGLSDTRFMRVRFSFIDNTGEESPAWRQEANELMGKLVDSMQIEGG